MSPRLGSVALALAVAVFGCAAEGDPHALTGGGKGDGGNVSASSPEDAAALPQGAFTYEAEIALLPFDVRLAKVARVAGVETSAPILEAMRARRLDLGDHDYAAGVKPDATWSAARIGTWVKSLRPVCSSPAMRSRYPALPERLDDLLLAAYGRAATPEDHAAIEETVAATALDSESQYQIVCLTILSSLEFVAR
jgi:hypothetical protein